MQSICYFRKIIPNRALCGAFVIVKSSAGPHTYLLKLDLNIFIYVYIRRARRRFPRWMGIVQEMPPFVLLSHKLF